MSAIASRLDRLEKAYSGLVERGPFIVLWVDPQTYDEALADSVARFGPPGRRKLAILHISDHASEGVSP